MRIIFILLVCFSFPLCAMNGFFLRLVPKASPLLAKKVRSYSYQSSSRCLLITPDLTAKSSKTTKKIDSIYDVIKNGSYLNIYKISPEEEIAIGRANRQNHNHAAVYGEIEDESIERIIHRLNIGPKDQIADFGCGRGRMVAYLMLATGAKLGFGVELSEKRANIAKQVSLEIKNQNILEPYQNIRFIHGDMTVVDLPEELTIAFFNSVLFSGSLIEKMSERLAKLPNLRSIIMVHRGFSTDNAYFELIPPQEYLPMSWERHDWTEEVLQLKNIIGDGTCNDCNVLFFAPKKSGSLRNTMK